MAAVIPPFESFYEEHRADVLRFLAGGSGATGPRTPSRTRSCVR